jgi:hypothetical protein
LDGLFIPGHLIDFHAFKWIIVIIRLKIRIDSNLRMEIGENCLTAGIELKEIVLKYFNGIL